MFSIVYKRFASRSRIGVADIQHFAPYPCAGISTVWYPRKALIDVIAVWGRALPLSPARFSTLPPSRRGGGAASRWQPPNSFGGGVLQRSETAPSITLRFSAGHFSAHPSRGFQRRSRNQFTMVETAQLSRTPRLRRIIEDSNPWPHHSQFSQMRHPYRRPTPIRAPRGCE
jgi:hypothetical protein